MTPERVSEFCLSLPGTHSKVQWHDDHVFFVGEKMFAVTGLASDPGISFNVEDERFLELTDLPGISPAPYLARAKWVLVDPAKCQLSDEDMEGLLLRSYKLVFAKLTKKVQNEISKVL